MANALRRRGFMKKYTALIALCGLAVLMAGCAGPIGGDFVIPRLDRPDNNYVLEYDLQKYVPIPVAGEEAVKAVDYRGDFRAVVIWKDEDGEVPNLDVFAENKEYQAEIQLTPRGGYFFIPTMSFTYNKGGITVVDDQGSPTRTVRVNYSGGSVDGGGTGSGNNEGSSNSGGGGSEGTGGSDTGDNSTSSATIGGNF
jgi:uncharacterized membrane protein YgcG